MSDVVHLTKLYDAWQALKNPSRADPEWRDWFAAKRAALAEFAAQRGWTIDPSWGFTIEMLRTPGSRRRQDSFRICESSNPYRIVDHPDFFKKDRRPVAIATHTYAPAEQVQLWAAEQRMHVEALPFSWYAPRRCLAYVITRPDDSHGALIQ